jgi:uncharacterized protein YegJ (DUF2314 family)
MVRSITVGFACLALFGCGKKNDTDKVVMVDDNDAAMNSAIAKARETVGTFVQALKSPKAGQRGFAVKFAIKDKNGTEHFWVTDVAFDGSTFRGKINNEPEIVKTVKFGQTVSDDKSHISDWMYIDSGKLVGGYTIRVLRDKLSAQERADFDRGVPFKFD